MRLIFSGLFLFSTLLATEQTPIKTIAQDLHPLFASAHWGVHVIDAKTQEVLYTHRASDLFIPASVTKLFTTSAALEALSPSYLFYTRIKAVHLPDSEGLLKGNLYLVGGGDPSLTSEGLQDLAKRVYAAGVRVISGAVVVDDALFDAALPIHAEYEDLAYDYAAQECALTINHNCATLTLLPNPEGQGFAIITAEQDCADIAIINAVITDKAALKPKITLTRNADQTLTVQGLLPFTCTSTTRKVAVLEPQEYARRIFVRALQDQGIAINHAHDDEAGHNEPLNELACLSSAPLLTILKSINQDSDNLAANMLLKTATMSALDALLQRVGIPKNALLLCDGSGLSRHNSMSPKQAVKLLSYMQTSDYRDAFQHSLAGGGMPGSLQKRFHKEPFKPGCILGKTGFMSGISNLAGFMELQNGRTLIFALFINHSLWSPPETAEALDKLVQYIFEHTRPGTREN